MSWVLSAMCPDRPETLFGPVRLDMDMESRTGRCSIPGGVGMAAYPVRNTAPGALAAAGCRWHRSSPAASCPFTGLPVLPPSQPWRSVFPAAGTARNLRELRPSPGASHPSPADRPGDCGKQAGLAGPAAPPAIHGAAEPAAGRDRAAGGAPRVSPSRRPRAISGGGTGRRDGPGASGACPARAGCPGDLRTGRTAPASPRALVPARGSAAISAPLGPCLILPAFRQPPAARQRRRAPFGAQARSLPAIDPPDQSLGGLVPDPGRRNPDRPGPACAGELPVPGPVAASRLHIVAAAMAAASEEGPVFLFGHRLDGGADGRPQTIRDRAGPRLAGRWRKARSAVDPGHGIRARLRTGGRRALPLPGGCSRRLGGSAHPEIKPPSSFRSVRDMTLPRQRSRSPARSGRMAMHIGRRRWSSSPGVSIAPASQRCGGRRDSGRRCRAGTARIFSWLPD